MSQSELQMQLIKLNKAYSSFPSQYYKKCIQPSNDLLGCVILYKLDNLRTILQYYLQYLSNQKDLFFASTKKSGTKPNLTNSELEIIQYVPKRPAKSKWSITMKNVYNKVDNVIKELDKSGFYKIMTLTDTVLGIDGSEYDGDLDSVTRYYIRKKIIANLGSY